MAKNLRNTSSVDNTGFSASSTTEGARIINPDGSPNIRKTGLSFIARTSIYHTLLRMPRMRFFLVVFGWYTSLNLLFAGIYYLIGVEHLQGPAVPETTFLKLSEAFFFSSQTLTTVGYGHMAPSGLLTNIIASIESFLGILMFALVTGIFYGRFSRPKAYLMFSGNVLVSPYKGDRALMIRLSTYKNNHLTGLEAILTTAIHIQENDQRVTRFFPLPLQIAKIDSLALSWTVVHLIDELSPFYSYTEQDFKDGRIEVMLNVKGFDDHFSNTVQQRTSYTASQLIYGAKFMPMFRQADDGSQTVIELDKIGDFERVALPEPVNVTI